MRFVSRSILATSVCVPVNKLRPMFLCLRRTVESRSSIDNNGMVILKAETSDGVVCFRKPIAALPGTESQQLIV
jgi:hypothetical protein